MISKVFRIIFYIFLSIGSIILVRLLRISHEHTPYYQYFNHSKLYQMSKDENIQPFRMGSLYTFPGIIQYYGIEGVDLRSPLFSRFYQDYFREIVNPQLDTEIKKNEFNNDWYQLSLTQTPGDHIEYRKNIHRVIKALNDLINENITINFFNVSFKTARTGMPIPISYLRNKIKIKEMIRNYADYQNGNATLPKYSDLINELEENSTFLNVHLLLSINTKYIISPYYDSYLDSVSSKIIISKSKTTEDNNFLTRPLKRLISNFEDPYGSIFYIYKLKNVFERGYLVKNALVLSNDREVLNALANESIDGLRDKVYFSSKDVFFSEKLYEKGEHPESNELNISQYSPDKIVFEGKTSSPIFLIVSNSFHPNWEVSINGKKSEIYRANHAFQAIHIDNAGEFTAVFEYNDPFLWETHLAVAVGYVFVISVFFIRNNKDHIST